MLTQKIKIKSRTTNTKMVITQSQSKNKNNNKPDTNNMLINCGNKTEICKHIKYYNYSGICKLEVFRVWYMDPEVCRAEEEKYGKQDDKAIMYGYNVCDDFGLSGKRCTRCGEDGGLFYCGQKMAEEECDEATELIELEDKKNGIFVFNYRKMYHKEVVIDLEGTEQE